jgi:hypothetical protein
MRFSYDEDVNYVFWLGRDANNEDVNYAFCLAHYAFWLRRDM